MFVRISPERILFFLHFAERILVHVPSRRPKISEILTSQWINNHHIKLESAFASTVKSTGGHLINGSSKKNRWFSRKRIIQKTDPSQTDTNLVQLYFNTKRANSVLEENFLHPINAIPSMSISTDGDSVNGGSGGGTIDGGGHVKSQRQRRSFFGNSLKKRIGPIEEKNKSNLFKQSNGIDEKISTITHSDQMHALRQTIETSSKHNSITSGSGCGGSGDDAIDDEEQGDFIMAPTNTDCMDTLHPLEIEARSILQKIGITNEMLCHAIESGPRSDVIGAYRIVINRLQRRKIMTRQQLHDQQNSDPLPMIQHKSDKMCAIL